jgi:urease accessory protein
MLRITSFTGHPHAQHQQTHRGAQAQPVLVKRASTLELDWDTAEKPFRRYRLPGTRTRFFLPRGTVVRGGDVLLAEDGSMVRVIAAPQTVLRITTAHAARLLT